MARHLDQEAISDLGGEMIRLATAIRVRFEPAARRLGCTRLLAELEAATSSDTPGTLRSLASVLGECLGRGEEW
jgi:hypothetical protein